MLYNINSIEWFNIYIYIRGRRKKNISKKKKYSELLSRIINFFIFIDFFFLLYLQIKSKKKSIKPVLYDMILCHKNKRRSSTSLK